jgi:histidine ammonia-lyase
MTAPRNVGETPPPQAGGVEASIRHVAHPGLRPAVVAAYASRTVDVDVLLTPEHLAPVLRGQRDLEHASEHGTVYGLTTGVGALRHITIEDPVADVEVGEPAPRDSHAMRLFRSHAAGVGPVLDDGLTRATMLVRLHQLLRGGSGASPDLVAGLGRALEVGALPTLHVYGGVGTGDLTVLAELGLTLAGELPWRQGGPEPTTVSEGDALPFMSSNALTATVGSVAITGLARLARAAEQVAALSHLALRGAVQAYDPRVHAAKDDPHTAGVAHRMLTLLDGADLFSVRVQDPFGLRAIPQVHGALEEMLAMAERALAAEIGAAGENPFAVDGQALHHGQFLTQRMAVSLDAVRAATVPVLTLSTARLGGLFDPALTDQPAFLAQGPVGSSGLMVSEYVAADVLARARGIADPVTGSRTLVSLGLEEHASHSTQSAWSTHALLALVPEVLACELVAAVRSLRMAPERLVAPACRELFERAEAAIPDVRRDHVIGPGLAAAAALVRSL